jgi:hypothetical protein
VNNIMACCPVDTSGLPQGPDLDEVLNTIYTTPGYETAICAQCGQLCHIGPRQIELLEQSSMRILCFACGWDHVAEMDSYEVSDLTTGTVHLYERRPP